MSLAVFDYMSFCNPLFATGSDTIGWVAYDGINEFLAACDVSGSVCDDMSGSMRKERGGM